MQQIILDIITSKDEILKALMDSKLSNSVVGITSEDLGHGTYLTSVKEVMYPDGENEPIIILRNYDLTGYFLKKNALRLSAIESIIPFKSVFENPFLREMERELAGRKTYLENNSLKAIDFLE